MLVITSSGNAKLMNTVPLGDVFVIATRVITSPRLDLILDQSPSSNPSFSASAGWISSHSLGTSMRKPPERPVMVLLW